MVLLALHHNGPKHGRCPRYLLKGLFPARTYYTSYTIYNVPLLIPVYSPPFMVQRDEKRKGRSVGTRRYLEHHLGLELAVVGHVVGVGRAERRVVVAEARQVIAELRRRRHRQEDLAAPSVRADLDTKHTNVSHAQKVPACSRTLG